MEPAHRVLVMLRQRIAEGQSGELIVANESLEAHLFLQRGRIAWAYGSETRGLFLETLRGLAELEEETLRGLLDACRAERRHVAETLIEWGMAEPEEVRHALRVQIWMTLRSILLTVEPEAIFLRRPAEQYSQELTFSLKEFETERCSWRPLLESDPELEQKEHALQQRLSEQLPTLLWVRLLRPGARSQSQDQLQLIAELMGELGARELAYRHEKGWLLGLAGENDQVFCGLQPHSILSKARRMLQEPPGAAAEGPLELGPLLPAQGSPPLLAPFRAIFDQVPQVACMAVAEESEVHWQERKGLPSCFHEDLRRAMLILGQPLSRIIQTDSPNRPATSRHPVIQPALRLVLPGYHLLGAPLSDTSTVWLALCPSVFEGLGWGLLANLLRNMRLDLTKSTE